MNVLIFDAPVRVGHLARSLLRSLGHRVSLSDDPDDAKAKLNTSLFDAVAIGPAGAPEELAEFLETEFPRLPVVLAGAPVEVPPQGPVVAVLREPLSPRRLASAFRRIEADRRRRLADLPVTLAAEGLSIACRLAELTPESMVLAGDSDAFRAYFGASPRRVQALVSDTRVEGDVLASDARAFRRVSRVDVRVDGPGARTVLTHLLRR